MNADKNYDDGDFSDDLDNDVDVLNIPLTNDDDYQILTARRGFGSDDTDSDDDYEGDFEFTVQDDDPEDEDEDILGGNPGGFGQRQSKGGHQKKHSNRKSSWIDGDF